MSGVALIWRGDFTSSEANELHGAAFGHRVLEDEWRGQVERWSLGWVCARAADGRLAGWVNVPWDGDAHALVMDTIVHPDAQRRGIGAALVAAAAEHARAAGCLWLHVDFDPEYRSFYFDACGFTPTDAGVIRLR